MRSEITDRYFQSLVSGPGAPLRKLVLLGCSKLTCTSLASCLRSLPLLEYFNYHSSPRYLHQSSSSN
ncbi:hypothetical protein IW261DRAFT_1483477 [Armillaria novae-zelandiae]|uniref:Uncharacterized protein n=1 Tax=Armillaria novae-zelandiae TaxID=153914 RepID=A0AA39P6E8_9AGAR|nr:hypothetical protein IW261DRAFT_1483477 [Armillaria novae-zelandiae]